MKWYIHHCPACGGDLHDAEDRGWVECLMCARAFRESELAGHLKASAELVAVERRHDVKHVAEERRRSAAA